MSWQTSSHESNREQTNLTHYSDYGYQGNPQNHEYRMDALKVAPPQNQPVGPSHGQRLALAIASLFVLLVALLAVIQITFTASQLTVNGSYVEPPAYLVPSLYVFFLLFLIGVIAINIIFRSRKMQ